jgi:hypothetical protein
VTWSFLDRGPDVLVWIDVEKSSSTSYLKTRLVVIIPVINIFSNDTARRRPDPILVTVGSSSQ